MFIYMCVFGQKVLSELFSYHHVVCSCIILLRLFGDNMPFAQADYDLVPTVVFSHPVIGTIGLTEQQAREKYPEEELKVYTSTFVNLYYGTFLQGEGGDKPLSKYKLICQGPEEKVVGLHMIGMGSDEVLQGFGVAMKMGATKWDFDRCIAIHPTAAEEMVTLAPWGMSKRPRGRL
jgi:glutathione reductase (NADPH)